MGMLLLSSRLTAQERYQKAKNYRVSVFSEMNMCWHHPVANFGLSSQ
jgi:hypothetical protein